MRFSLITSTPSEMYAFNPFINTPAVAPLTMEAFIAPADFDPDAQELNIVKAFAAYPDVNKKFVFSFSNSVNIFTLLFPIGTTYIYHYSENGGAFIQASGTTISWTAGSNRRIVIVSDITSSIPIMAPIGAKWVYANDKCTSITSQNNNYLNYIHCQSLSSITSLPAYCFSHTGLSGILSLPNLLGFGDSCFWACTGLTGVLNIPNSYTSTSNYLFYGCTGLTGISFGNSMQTIGSESFNGCTGLTSLVMPNSVITITYGAFANCSNILTVNFGTSLQYLTGVNGREDIGCFTNCTKINSLSLPVTLKTIGYGCFNNCTGIIGALIIPNSVTLVDKFAFNNCIRFTSINLGNGITTLKNASFRYMTGLIGTFEIKQGVTIIEGSSLEMLSNITRVIIPSSVVTIQNNALYANPSFLRIDVHASVPPTGLGSGTFNQINRNGCIIHVPIGSLAVYQAAPYWNEFTNIIDDL